MIDKQTNNITANETDGTLLTESQLAQRHQRSVKTRQERARQRCWRAVRQNRSPRSISYGRYSGVRGVASASFHLRRRGREMTTDFHPTSRVAILARALSERPYRALATTRGDSEAVASWLELRGQPQLARKIRRCRPHARCLSPACGQCGSVEQLVFVEGARRFIGRQREDLMHALVTIVAPDSAVAIGQLAEWPIEKFRRRVRDWLARTNAVWGIGGIDLSLNVDAAKRHEPFWCPQCQFDRRHARRRRPQRASSGAFSARPR